MLQSELKAVGIGLSIQLVAETTYTSRSPLGQFELTNSSQPYTTPYGFYDFYMGSAGTAPIGKTATTDWGRYREPSTQTLLQELNGAKPGTAASTAALNRIETVFVKEAPFIPLFTNGQTGVFNTSKVTGFPTASNLLRLPVGDQHRVDRSAFEARQLVDTERRDVHSGLAVTTVWRVLRLRS